jgi:hypothetical protein
MLIRRAQRYLDLEHHIEICFERVFLANQDEGFLIGMHKRSQVICLIRSFQNQQHAEHL